MRWTSAVVARMLPQFLTVDIRRQLLVVLALILVTSRSHCKAAAGGDPATVGLGETMDRNSGKESESNQRVSSS